MNDPEARSRFRQEMLAFLGSDKYRGLMIDFEAFPKKGQPGFLALLNELSGDLHTRGLKLYVAVPSHNDEWNYPKVSAAADGVVLMKAVDVGEVVAPGTTIVTVGNIDHPWLRGYVNETDLGKVKIGSKVRVTTDTYPGKVYNGRVSFIASSRCESA